MSKKRIHCYAASFSNDLAKVLIKKHCPRGGLVVDPFAGSGTTLIESLSAGNHAIGIDVDPIAILISKTQTGRYSHKWLDGFQCDILAALTILENELRLRKPPAKAIIPGSSFGVNGYMAHIPQFPEIAYWFSPNQTTVLAALTAFARTLKNRRKRRIFDLAISSTIVRKWPSTLSCAMDIDHSRPHKGTPVFKTVKQQFKLFKRVFSEIIQILQKTASLAKCWPADAKVIQGDSVTALTKLGRGAADLVLTSPPYVNAINYPRAHKFSEWWLNPKAQLCKRENYIGLRGTRKEDLSKRAHQLAPESMNLTRWLENKSPSKYYLLCKYVDDMAKVISGCKHVIRHNGKIVFVLADNKIGGRTVPIVKIVKEILKAKRFKRVKSVRRKIKHQRRRYPFGFEGVMKSEAIISALRN